MDVDMLREQDQAVDHDKAKAMKHNLSGVPGPGQIVALAQFFDGNDDLGSFGCTSPATLG